MCLRCSSRAGQRECHLVRALGCLVSESCQRRVRRRTVSGAEFWAVRRQDERALKLFRGWLHDDEQPPPVIKEGGTPADVRNVEYRKVVRAAEAVSLIDDPGEIGHGKQELPTFRNPSPVRLDL